MLMSESQSIARSDAVLSDASASGKKLALETTSDLRRWQKDVWNERCTHKGDNFHAVGLNGSLTACLPPSVEKMVLIPPVIVVIFVLSIFCHALQR